MSENIQKSPLPCGGGLGVGETQSIKQGYKQTSLGILPQEWEVVRFNDIFIRIPSKKYQIQTKEYQSNGKYPVIDQGQTAVIGYSNNDNKVFKNSSVIVFGDHTRELKFVDFDFIVGADGVQLLKTKENFDNRFFYYQLKTKKIPSTGYNRHFKFLLDMSFVCPTLAEQEKIAQILGVWDKGISVLKSLIEAKTKRKKALMQRLLTPPTHPLTPSAREGEQKSHHDTKAPPLAGGVGVGYSHIENNRNDDKVLDCHDLTASNLAMTEKNSKAKQSLRFAEFTDKWQEMRLGDILEYEQPTKYLVKNTEYSNLYQTPVLTAGKTFILGKTNENFGVYKDLPIILFDDFMTTSKFVDFPFKVKSSASKILKPKTNNINLKIVFEMMQTIDFCAKDHKRYWISEYQNLTIKLPTLAEQKKIAQVLSACDKEIELLKSKFQCLKTQKKGLMQRLLNGEVRVKC